MPIWNTVEFISVLYSNGTWNVPAKPQTEFSALIALIVDNSLINVQYTGQVVFTVGQRVRN